MGETIAIIFSQSLSGSEAFLGFEFYRLTQGPDSPVFSEREYVPVLSTVQEQECVWDFILIDSK